MIDATPILQPERERPDLYVGVWPPEEGCTVHITTLASRSAVDVQKHEDNCHKGLVQTFRLPGTRRAKLQADAMRALGEWNAAWLQNNDDGSEASHVRFYLACKRLSDAYTALAELDAKQEGEK